MAGGSQGREWVGSAEWHGGRRCDNIEVHGCGGRGPERPDSLRGGGGFTGARC